MDLMEEMWISRPQRRITKLSDLSDGGVIARIKFYNANKEYTVDSFKLMFEDYKKSIYCCQDFIELCQIINDYDYIVDYINNSHFRNELDIFTPEFPMRLRRYHTAVSYPFRQSKHFQKRYNRMLCHFQCPCIPHSHFQCRSAEQIRSSYCHLLLQGTLLPLAASVAQLHHRSYQRLCMQESCQDSWRCKLELNKVFR